MIKQTNKLIAQLWQTHKGMSILFLASTVWLLIALVGMAVDSRMVLGHSTWAKSMKFAFSFMAYAPTLAWLYTFVTHGRRVFKWALNGVAVTLLIELGIILTQGIRGEVMHFNMSTPLDSILWAMMGIAIFIFFIFTIVGFVVILRQKLADRALTHSIRWGFAIMVLGLVLGTLMTGPTAEQAAILETGVQTEYIGAHTVGAPDGGPGLPVTGWSTEHGDLRIAHFIGLHGLQFVPLVGWWLFAQAKCGRSRFSSKQRLQIVWTSALTYLSIVLLVTWQALRGQSIVQPDILTISVFATILAAASMSIIIANRGAAPQPTTAAA